MFYDSKIRKRFKIAIAPLGVRSDRGNEWHERFWTVLATCKRRGLNVLAFLRESIFCLLHGLSPPSLLKPHNGN